MNQVFNYLSARICYFLFGFNKIPFYLHYLVAGIFFYEPIKRILKNRVGNLLIIFLPALIVFSNFVRNGFFFQSDDFAHLKIAAEYSYMDILIRALGNQGLWGFHHIFLPLWVFKTAFIFFKTNATAYLVVNLLLHLSNIFLLFSIAKKVKIKSFYILPAFLFSGFFLNWISDIWEFTYAFFTLLVIFFWLSFLKENKKNDLILSVIFFVLALFSYEKAALLILALFSLSVFYNSFVAKINLKKILWRLAPFLLIAGAHFLIYGRIFLTFFNISGSGGYRTAFSAQIIIKNLLNYVTLVMPAVNNSIIFVSILLLALIIFDLWQRKLMLLPLVFSYLILVSPALFFESKFAPYYGYTPSIFLYLLLAVFFAKIYKALYPYFSGNKLLLKVFTIYMVLIITFGIFRMDSFFMNNCFLIQSPWANPHRIALNSLSSKLDSLFSTGDIKSKTNISLSENEVTHEMKYLFTTNALYLFLKDKNAIEYTFLYNEKSNSLEVKKESSFHKISF